MYMGDPVLGTEDTTVNSNKNNNKTFKVIFFICHPSGGGSIDNYDYSYSSSDISVSPICGTWWGCTSWSCDQFWLLRREQGGCVDLLSQSIWLHLKGSPTFYPNFFSSQQCPTYLLLSLPESQCEGFVEQSSQWTLKGQVVGQREEPLLFKAIDILELLLWYNLTDPDGQRKLKINSFQKQTISDNDVFYKENKTGSCDTKCRGCSAEAPLNRVARLAPFEEVGLELKPE